jgi:hypothetical protein
VIQLAGLGDREKSLRYTGFEAFVDYAEVESHGNRRSLVRSGIEKFAIEHDGDGNQASPAITGELNQADCARSGIGCLAACLLNKFLRLQAAGEDEEAADCNCSRKDDGAHPVAI